jgi:predicted Co/Zn/Cd cation transporter (cation efflux family)
MSEQTAVDGHAGALRDERRMLLTSTAAAGFFAALGIVWGAAASSQVILLDGIYALIGIALGALSLRASALVARGPTDRYPFGREALAPVVVGVQGLVLLGSLVFAVLDALSVIANGGSETALGSALLYALISLAGSVLLWLILRRGAGSSELVGAEAAQWWASILLALGLVIGFGFAVFIQGGDWERVVPYVDPVLVLAAAAFIAPTPLQMLRTTWRELLEGAPAPEVMEPIEEAIAATNAAFGLPEPQARVGKLGRKLYIELDYLVPVGRWEVSDADAIRRDLHARLTEPGRMLWLNVELHTDPEWDVE